MTTLPPPSTPAGWYPNPSGEPGQRYFDGSKWTDALTPPPNPVPEQVASKSRKWPWVVGGIVVLLIVISAIGGNDDKKDDKKPTSPAAVQTQPNAQPMPGLGSEVRDGKFSFVVSKVDRSATAGDPDNPFLQSKAKGEFVIVSLKVTNVGDKAQGFLASNQKLIAGGKTFTADTIASISTNEYDLNPGLSTDATLAFDVPAGTIPETLEVHDSMFSGGAKINLG